jgi:tryptophanyl-tRNA synthetase
MSKSYNNAIAIFAEGKDLKKQVNAIVTDSREPAEAKEPDSVNAYGVLALFLTREERTEWEDRLRAGGVGYGDLKKALIEKMDARFCDAREVYRELMTTSAGAERLEAILERGAARARPVAQATLWRCLDAVGMPNPKRRLQP